LKITVDTDHSYAGGHYFGVLELPVGEGKYIELGEREICGRRLEVVEWKGKHRMVEYWECDGCYHG
jgi:hypothetical protein